MSDRLAVTQHIRRTQAWSAWAAMVEHDLVASWRVGGWLSLRVLVQPALFVFVFGFVFPRIGQPVGGQATDSPFATLLLSGTISSTGFIHSLQAVAFPLVRDLGFTREIEDRAGAPYGEGVTAASKVAAGTVEGVIAAALVAPVAMLAPVDFGVVHITPATVLAILGCAIMGSTIGLVVGSVVSIDKVSLLFSFLIVPMLFLGATYFPWAALESLRWLQLVTLLNPMLYANELVRWTMSDTVPSMNPVVSGGVLIALTCASFYFGVSRLASRIRGA